MSGLGLLLERTAARRGDAPAIHTETGSVSWEELHRRVVRVAEVDAVHVWVVEQGGQLGGGKDVAVARSADHECIDGAPGVLG